MNSESESDEQNKNGNVNPLTISKADTGIQTIVVPEFSPAAFGENPTVIVATLQGGPFTIGEGDGMDIIDNVVIHHGK